MGIQYRITLSDHALNHEQKEFEDLTERIEELQRQIDLLKIKREKFRTRWRARKRRANGEKM